MSLVKRKKEFSMPQGCKMSLRGLVHHNSMNFFASRNKTNIWRCFCNKIETLSMKLNQVWSLLKRKNKYSMQQIGCQKCHDTGLVQENSMNTSPLGVKCISGDNFATRDGCRLRIFFNGAYSQLVLCIDCGIHRHVGYRHFLLVI